MCLSLFVIPVSALESYDTSHISIYSSVSLDNMTNSVITYPNNGILESSNLVHPFLTPRSYAVVTRSFYLASSDGIMFPKERNVRIWLKDISINDLIELPNGEQSYALGVTAGVIKVRVHYADGSLEMFDGTLTSQGGSRLFDLSVDFLPKKDVEMLGFTIDNDIVNNSLYQTALNGNLVVTVHNHIGETVDGSLTVQFEQSSEESTWLAKIKNGIDNLKTSINELPTKFWEKIETGLKNLFVPSEQSMTAYKDKWDELLATRFGAVYQVVNIITDSWDSIMAADETDTINFPSATINFSDTPFTFGGYEVKIVPDGFDILVTAIKSVVAIVCTVAFINGLRKRYDEIMGVEQ